MKVKSKNSLRIHRNALINTAFIDEVHGWFSGRIMVRLDLKKWQFAAAYLQHSGALPPVKR